MMTADSSGGNASRSRNAVTNCAHTKNGAIRLIDFMPPRGENPDIIRIIEGVRGAVGLTMELIIRFDYGRIVPWVRKRDGSVEAAPQRPISVSGIVREVVKGVTAMAGQSGVELKSNLCEDACTLLGDSTQMTRAIQNVI